MFIVFFDMLPDGFCRFPGNVDAPVRARDSTRLFIWNWMKTG
jgi:hypothetical protein